MNLGRGKNNYNLFYKKGNVETAESNVFYSNSILFQCFDRLQYISLSHNIKKANKSVQDSDISSRSGASFPTPT